LEEHARKFAKVLIKLYLDLDDDGKHMLFSTLVETNDAIEITEDAEYAISCWADTLAEVLFPELVGSLRFRKGQRRVENHTKRSSSSIEDTVRYAKQNYSDLLNKLARHSYLDLITLLRESLVYIPSTTECQCQGETDCRPCTLRRKIKKVI